MALKKFLRNKLIDRYDTSGVSFIQRHYEEQFYYGQREVLLEFLNLPETYYLKAVLSHGNIFPDDFDPIAKRVDKYGREILQIVTRTDSAEIAKQKGINAISIGSVGLYALENMGQSMEESKENIRKFTQTSLPGSDFNEFLEHVKNKKILYMPLHSWEGDVISGTNMYFEKLAKVHENMTVCLGYIDFIDPETRAYYHTKSGSLTCAGMRSSIILNSPAGGRPRFLYNLFKIINEHDIVVADEMTTGLMYAILVGKQVRLLPSSDDTILNYSSWRDLDAIKQFHKKTRKLWPWLTGNKIDQSKIEQDIFAALGINSFSKSEFLIDKIEFGQF